MLRTKPDCIEPPGICASLRRKAKQDADAADRPLQPTQPSHPQTNNCRLSSRRDAAGQAVADAAARRLVERARQPALAAVEAAVALEGAADVAAR
jgi:hypothetical protein